MNNKGYFDYDIPKGHCVLCEEPEIDLTRLKSETKVCINPKCVMRINIQELRHWKLTNK